MIRVGVVLAGAFLALMGIYFLADGRRKEAANLVFAGAAICLIAVSVTLFAVINPAYSVGLR